MAIEAYVGWPIIDRERGVIGIVVCLYDRPIARDEVPRSILELYSLNIGAEMTRKLANQELRDSLRESKDHPFFNWRWRDCHRL